MIKPLLRTIPTLSGNVKLACTLLDYNKIDKDTFETNIRGAHIYPLSSQLFQKNIEANLLNSSWEFDIKKFYLLYSDIFFESCFNYNKTEIPILDKTLDIYPRNTDFEYGVKRISYSKSSNQFACFAPIYLDDVNDIPEYFLLKIKLVSKKHSTIKYIKVNIASNKTKNITTTNNNYIYHYIYKYINKIDDNVVFINNGDKTVNYYGIDLINGGFTKYTDTTISAILDTCIPMQMFDFSISEGFKRNRMCMRQSLPLCFYFNISDILNSTEQERYKFAELYFSGAYHIIKNGIDVELPWYDFDWDYDNYSQSILDVNPNNGMLRKTNGYLENIMDVGFPAFNDRYLTNFQFANRFTPIFNRWKLKYSSDEHPYITNMSWAFSGNQDNNYKYREFPVQYTNQPGYAIVNDSLEYNLILPIGDTKIHYDNINSKSTVKYNSILENYCLNWFDVLETDSLAKDSLINTVNWVDVNDGYTYFNGVLYNLNNIYNKVELTNDNDKINKFAIVVNPITNNIYNATNNELIFTKYSFSKTGELNCCLNNVFDEHITDLYNLTGENNYAIDETGIFSEITETDSEIDFTNVYVNLLNVNKSYIELNKLYNINEPEFEKIKNLYVPEDEYKNLDKDLSKDNANFNEVVGNLVGILQSKIVDKFTTAFTGIDEFYEPILDVLATAFCSYNSDIHESYDAIPDIFKTVFGKELFCEVPVYRSSSYMDGLNTYINKTEGMSEALSIFDNLYISSKNNITPTKISENTNIIRELGNTTYGQMLYFKSNFINTTMFDDESKKSISTNIFGMYRIWQDSNGEQFNLVNLEIENTPEYNLKTALTRFYTNILDECKGALNGDIANTYEFLPITEYNGKLVAQNTCRRYQTKIANIDSVVSGNLFDTDDNVLFVHEYNFANVCRAAGVDINKLPSTEKYVKVLDKNYLDKMFLKGENTFYKQSKVILPDFTVKFKYEEINDEALTKIEFDNETKLFYNPDNKNDKFNIAEYATVYKINKSLFESTFNKTEFFIDLLVFRPITNIEYDEKYSGKCQVFIRDENTKDTPISNIPSNSFLDALNYIDYNLLSQYNDGVYSSIMLYDKYDSIGSSLDASGSDGSDSEPDINDDPNPGGTIKTDDLAETDEFLYPCFNDFNYQTKENTLLNKNIILDNINDISVNDGETDDDIYKRYNTSDFYAFVSIDKDTYDSFGYSKPILYEKLHTKKFVELYTGVNENPVYTNKPQINVFTDEYGITYGIYILNVDMNNTHDFFNIRGVVDTDENSLNSNNIDELAMLKIFNYVNNVSIVDNPYYLKRIFKQLCPFMNINLLNEIHNLNIIVNPHTFNLVNTYYTSKDNVNNNSKELKLIYDKQTIITVKKQILQRYTHNIIPHLKETLVIPALPKLKYKTIKQRLLDTGMYYSIGDVVFDVNKNSNINIPYNINIYGESDDLSIKSYNNIIGSFTPHEYKYYNNSKLRNLPTELTFTGKTLYIYSQIVEMESEENTIRIFKNLISKYIDSVEDNELILFLYKKYKKSYNATTKGTNIALTDKVYKLEYKFTLL